MSKLYISYLYPWNGHFILTGMEQFILAGTKWVIFAGINKFGQVLLLSTLPTYPKS